MEQLSLSELQQEMMQYSLSSNIQIQLIQKAKEYFGKNPYYFENDDLVKYTAFLENIFFSFLPKLSRTCLSSTNLTIANRLLAKHIKEYVDSNRNLFENWKNKKSNYFQINILDRTFAKDLITPSLKEKVPEMLSWFLNAINNRLQEEFANTSEFIRRNKTKATSTTLIKFLGSDHSDFKIMENLLRSLNGLIYIEKPMDIIFKKEIFHYHGPTTNLYQQVKKNHEIITKISFRSLDIEFLKKFKQLSEVLNQLEKMYMIPHISDSVRREVNINDLIKIPSELINDPFFSRLFSPPFLTLIDLENSSVFETDDEIISSSGYYIEKFNDKYYGYVAVYSFIESISIMSNKITIQMLPYSKMLQRYAKQIAHEYLELNGLLARLKPVDQYEQFDGSRGVLDIQSSIIESMLRGTITPMQRYKKKINEEPAHLFIGLDNSSYLGFQNYKVACFFINIASALFEDNFKSLSVSQLSTWGRFYTDDQVEGAMRQDSGDMSGFDYWAQHIDRQDWISSRFLYVIKRRYNVFSGDDRKRYQEWGKKVLDMLIRGHFHEYREAYDIKLELDQLTTEMLSTSDNNVLKRLRKKYYEEEMLRAEGNFERWNTSEYTKDYSKLDDLAELFYSYKGDQLSEIHALETIAENPRMSQYGLKYVLIFHPLVLNIEWGERWYNEITNQYEMVAGYASFQYWLKVISKRKDCRLLFVWFLSRDQIHDLHGSYSGTILKSDLINAKIKIHEEIKKTHLPLRLPTLNQLKSKGLNAPVPNSKRNFDYFSIVEFLDECLRQGIMTPLEKSFMISVMTGGQSYQDYYLDFDEPARFTNSSENSISLNTYGKRVESAPKRERVWFNPFSKTFESLPKTIDLQRNLISRYIFYDWAYKNWDHILLVPGDGLNPKYYELFLDKLNSQKFIIN